MKPSSVLKEVQAVFGDRVFKSRIAYSVRAKDSVVSGKSILDYDRKSTLGAWYRAPADEIYRLAEAA